MTLINDLDLIFKVTRVYIYEKALSTLFFLKQWSAFDQTYIDTSFLGLGLIFLDLILAHLSQRLKWGISMSMVWRPSSSSIHTFKVVYL